MMRMRIAGLLAAFLVLLPAVAPAADQPLRSYIAPQEKDDDRPRPRPARCAEPFTVIPEFP